MEKTLATLVPTFASHRKSSARVAFVDLADPARHLLSDCFRQFGMDSVDLNGNAMERLQAQKYEACVLRFGPHAAEIIEAARNSRSNNRMIIYGLGGSAQEALRYSRYGINAIFHEPLERSSALKLVRATQTLVLHEFRRYVRIPVITEVSVVAADGRRFTATSREISSGGMSLTAAEELDTGQQVEISFALLTLPRIWIRSVVSWRRSNKSFGIRFDSKDDRRFRIKDWIDAYLEN
jgi:hypothetical protein